MEEDDFISSHSKAKADTEKRERERVIGWGTQLTQKFEVVKRKKPLYQRD